MLLVLTKLALCFTLSSNVQKNLLDERSNDPIEITNHQIGRLQNLEFENCVLRKCVSLGETFDKEAGGAICTFKCSLNFSNCIFTENIANYASCICCFAGDMIIYNSTFMNSKSFADVGAVWSMSSTFENERSVFNISFSKFINNKSGRFHGAISANLTNPIIINCEFENNRAEKAVGALAINTLKDALIENTIFINNTSGDKFNGMFCPCLYLQGCSENKNQRVILNKCFFSNNIGYDQKMHGIATYNVIDIHVNGCICFDGNANDFFEGPDQKTIFIESNLIFNSINSLDQCKCMLPPTASNVFTETIYFTKSSDFSQSTGFSKSSNFLPSDEFSRSLQFSKSSNFLPSDEFTGSLQFSKSSSFLPSDRFSNSLQFSQSSNFIPSKEFSNSEKFTKSSNFDPTNHFSESNSLKTKQMTPQESESTEKFSDSLSNSESDSESFSESYSEEQSTSEITSPPEEKKNDKKSLPDFAMGALGGGLGLLLLLIILIIICCCCRKKKKEGCCLGRRKEKEVVTETIKEPILITVPRVNEYDDGFISYVNPDYDKDLYEKA